MSRAFVREPDGSEPPEPMPDRPVPDGPNPVTAEGLARMEAEIARLAAIVGPQPLDLRDLRYWRRRHATAAVTDAPADGTAGFGAGVTLAGLGPAPRRVRIVGEDEADAAAGLIGWRAPLAEAVDGAGEGDAVAGPGGRTLTVLRVEGA